MTLDQAVRWVRPVRTSRPPTAAWVLAGSVVAWAVLTVGSPAATQVGGAAPGHVHQHHGGAAVDPWTAAWVLGWLLMVAAMTWPLAVPTLSAVGRAAFRGWRVRLVATCLVSVTVLWLGAGLAIASVARALAVPAGSGGWQLGWVAAAVLWSRSAWRARLLWRCARLPAVAPGGVRGLASATVAGAVAWRRCALLCLPVMTAMVVGHDPGLMLGASVSAWWEAAHPRAWRDPVPVLLLAATGVWLLLPGVVPRG
ncbi:MAG TPA: hypothetical protein VEZ18_01315 [Geodermatophilus sp.]|nr:hypothetical protein [Geodermatophilus sp.]